MTALEDFENTLKEIVNARRVSASKMNRLTEIAMKSLADDTKLVASLYRTHKSLPGSAKVSSLYVFDALARAARSTANKRGDAKSEKGNAATFLLKIEGVLDGLFHDMVSLDSPEAKEKTKKVLDIWVKSNTFPPAVLTRMRDILSDIPKETAVNSAPPVGLRATTEASATITTSQMTPNAPSAPPNVQATLLALLGQAAQIAGQGQPPVQTLPSTDSQVHQSQLALLQQLALTAKLSNGSPTPPLGQTPPPTDGNSSATVISGPEPSHSPRPPQSSSHFDKPGGARYGQNGYGDHPRDRQEQPLRGGHRGGFRGRGRGRWEDHNRDRFRHRGREDDPPLRSRRSRSRSPRRPEERRNVRPNSPPRYLLNDRDPRRPPELSTPTSAHGKDEFGRDIRVTSSSPSRSSSTEDTQAHAPIESSVDPTAGVLPDYHIPVSDQLPLVAASTSAQSTETHTPSSTSQQQPGLDQFDISTFDATTPSSWEGLGSMWQTTYGYPPSQEELMHFVMTGSMAAAGMANGGFNGQWQQGNKADHGSRHNGGWRGGRGRGRGNHAGGRGGHGNYRDEDESTESEPNSYAVVLNGDAEPSLSMDTDQVHDAGQTGRGGRMQRVGDKWVFVKEGESGA